MPGYGEMQRAQAEQNSVERGTAEHRTAARDRTLAADALNESPRSQSLMQLRAALDGSPRVQALQGLSRALNRPREPEHDEPEQLQESRPAALQFAALTDDADKPDDPPPVQKKTNATGLPDRLKAGVEQLSGLALDDVRVHYNSQKPAAVQAHAYAQGSDIHVAPGQERHLPHEAWHVVQQKQGRVKPTLQIKSVAINDDAGLEREADRMETLASDVAYPLNSLAETNAEEFNATAETIPVRGTNRAIVTQRIIVLDEEEIAALTEQYGSTIQNLHNDPQFYTRAQAIERAGQQNANVNMGGQDSNAGSNVSTDDDSGEMQNDYHIPEVPAEYIITEADEHTIAVPKKEPDRLITGVIIGIEPKEDAKPIGNKYKASEVEISGIVIPRMRHDTQFGSEQKEHTVAFTLFMYSIEQLRGKDVATALNELFGLLKSLKDIPGQTAECMDIIDKHAGQLFGTINSAIQSNQDPELWRKFLGGAIELYITADQKSIHASYERQAGKKEYVKGWGREDICLQHLRTQNYLLENADTVPNVNDLANAAAGLLDANMSEMASDKYAYAVYYWGLAIQRAFPFLWNKFRDAMIGPVLNRPYKQPSNIGSSSSSMTSNVGNVSTFGNLSNFGSKASSKAGSNVSFGLSSSFVSNVNSPSMNVNNNANNNPMTVAELLKLQKLDLK